MSGSVHVHIENVFPTPVYTCQLTVDDYNIDHLEFIENFYDKNGILMKDTSYLTVTKNQRLLETDAKFASLKEVIDVHMMHYYTNILGFDNTSVYPEMVSSWIVKSSPNQSSIFHTHPNSMFSGVLYLQVPENSGGIIFKKKLDLIPHFSIPVNKNTLYNSKYSKIDAKKGFLLLFPSWLSHKVEENSSEQERISVAFNYFLKGDYVFPAAMLSIR
jgi:uncharacterized protein (TIGR02466 family)